MAAELVRQPVRKTSGLLVALLTLVAAVFVAAAVAAAVLVRRKRHAGKADAPEPEAVPVPDRSGAAKTPSSISLLGGLSIIDSEGNDVTTEFSPISRQLLLLILMNSKVKPVGITSEVLDDTLWYGMERKQAANNRNVNIRKLRLRLEKVWDVELTGRNGYWFFALEDLSRCDYLEVGQLMKDVLAKPDDRARLNRLLTLVMNGPLLPDNDFEWLDDYKSRYTNMIIENLVKIQRFWEDDDDMSIMIARAMRVQDIIDEEAIRIYCRALYRKGSRSQSRSAWDKFTEDYRRIMGTLPDFSWSQIIEG